MGKKKKFSTKLKKIREQMHGEGKQYNLVRFIDHVLEHASWERIRLSELEHDDFEQELVRRIENLTDRIDSSRRSLQRYKDKYSPIINNSLVERKLYIGINRLLYYQKPYDMRPSRYASPLRLYEDKKKDEERQRLESEKHED